MTISIPHPLLAMAAAFLAGGINAENITKAVELGIYGIDVCSGVESKPGKKDHAKMRKLFDMIQDLRG